MAVYLFLILLLEGVFYAYHCNIRIPGCKILVFMLLWLVAGLRFQVGKDFTAYADMFVDPLDVNRHALEPVWIWTMDVLREWGFGSRVWFLFTAFVTNGLILYGIYKLSPDFYLSVLLYVVITGCYYESFNIIRQYFAISILFATFHYVLEHKIWKYILAILVATCFHISALTMLPLVFILKIRFPVWSLWTLFAVSILFGSQLMMWSVSNIIPSITLYAGYANDAPNLEIDTGMLKFFYIILGGGLLLTFPRISNQVPGKTIYLNAAIIALAIYFIFRDMQVFSRISWYLFPFFTVSIPYACRALNIRSRIIVLPVVIIVFALFLLKHISGETYSFDLKLFG